MPFLVLTSGFLLLREPIPVAAGLASCRERMVCREILQQQGGLLFSFLCETKLSTLLITSIKDV